LLEYFDAFIGDGFSVRGVVKKTAYGVVLGKRCKTENKKSGKE
jgi:hypothetical protein